MTPDPVAALREDRIVQARLCGREMTFHTTWGLFSPKSVDEGSALLLEYAEVAPDARVLDLGCGYGPIGLRLAADAPRGEALLVDKDFVAVAYARRNAEVNGLTNVEVRLSNGLAQVPETGFDLIASNFPAKVGNELLSIFMHDAHARLTRGGRMYVVTISGLREHIKRTLRAVFGNYTKVKQGKTYTVASAVREKD